MHGGFRSICRSRAPFGDYLSTGRLAVTLSRQRFSGKTIDPDAITLSDTAFIEQLFFIIIELGQVFDQLQRRRMHEK